MSLTSTEQFFLTARRKLNAWFVRFDPTGTTLVSTNVQDAIVEIDTTVASLSTAVQSAVDVLEVQVFS